jgi:FKBP-type peptidyl-prolyl cis-trans isomerase
MTGKAISIWAVVIIILIGGGILFWQFGTTGTGTPEPSTDTQTQATSTQQVAGQDVTVGTGKEAKPGTIVSVLYVGRLQDGTVFDSSEANGNQPLRFQLGAEGLIPGFQIGINGMKEGGERRIAIPPEFAYGTQDVKDKDGKTIIPANSTIVFDIRLVKLEDATSTPSTSTTTAQ